MLFRFDSIKYKKLASHAEQIIAPKQLRGNVSKHYFGFYAINSRIKEKNWWMFNTITNQKSPLLSEAAEAS